jgi:hypothetical protein
MLFHNFNFYLQYVSRPLAYGEKQRQSSVYVMSIRHALYTSSKQNDTSLARKAWGNPRDTLGAEISK